MKDRAMERKIVFSVEDFEGTARRKSGISREANPLIACTKIL